MEMRSKNRLPWLFVGNLLAVAGLGMLNLSSAVADAGHTAWTQLAWFGLGCAVAVLFAALDYRMLERVAYPFFTGCILLLLLVLGLGRVVQGSRRWFSLLGFNLQPSELAKIGLVLVLARYFAEEGEDAPAGGYTLRRIIKPLSPVWALGATAALIVGWERIEHVSFAGLAADLANWRFLMMGILLAWMAGGGLWIWRGPPALRWVRFFGHPASPLYALLAALVWMALTGGGFRVIRFGAFDIHLGAWRFLLLGLLLAWGAATILRAIQKNQTRLHDLLSPAVLTLLPALLILKQPDLGTTLVFFLVAGTMIVFVRLRWVSLLITLLVLAMGTWLAWNHLLHGYQKKRLESFLAPATDVMGSGYHAHQSIIAVGSGQATGKGFRASTQTQFKFLPEQQTDFVFSVFAEEWGFWGCLLVLVLFFLLLVQMVDMAAGARDRFGILLGVGVIAMIFWQAFINIGMVIGLLPVVGITLPWWSYGGSSMLAVMMGVGLLLSVALRRFVEA
ncbi:MAG: rod shape-determining protein RodA [Myxococcales bacterium]|nr:rod shape-determining protein RodA [Myxococcales bacterium]